jgi:hypothetical protein
MPIVGMVADDLGFYIS